MQTQRSCGILLHISSLPGQHGIGTMGQEAFHVADLLALGGQTYWQVLPLHPVTAAFGYSPYACLSAFAGNPLLISLMQLKKQSWCDVSLDENDFPDEDFVDYDRVAADTEAMLSAVADCFLKKAPASEKKRFEAFCKRESFWLEDFALFAACAEQFKTQCWLSWESSLALRKPEAIAHWAIALQSRVHIHKCIQYFFFSQWKEFKKYCNSKGLRIIGDLPIYVPLDSADAWAHPEIFQLDPHTRKPTFVAGVPPDYFSKTGQLWGNPLYQWRTPDKHLCEETLRWWVHRMRHALTLADVVRIDHFRGFQAYWAVPAGETTAVRGKWRKGPGAEFFKRLHEELGDMPVIAEDLGHITPDVVNLRTQLAFPGMKVLQFAFDHNNKNPYLPHTYTDPHCVVYTGTHDNNTTNGWFYGAETDDATRRYAMEYIGTDRFSDFHWHLIRLAYQSVALVVIIPAQDLLGYGAEFRMNTPGTVTGNWRWKLKRGALTEELMMRLRRLAHLYDRIPDRKNPA